MWSSYDPYELGVLETGQYLPMHHDRNELRGK